MKSRFAITLLCVGAVGFACGPRARSEANSGTSSATSTASTHTVSQQGAPLSTSAKAKAKASATPIAASLGVTNEGASLRLALQVVNRGKKSVELTFPSGQTHDFVVLDSLGREVWRWSQGRLFTQALQNKLLSRGESLSMSETWQAPALKAGRYTAIAVLKSENYPVTERVQFAIGGATLAIRD